MKRIIAIVIASLLIFGAIYNSNDSQPSINAISQPEKLNTSTKIIDEVVAGKTISDKVIFYLSTGLDLNIALNGTPQNNNKQQLYFYLFGQKKANNHNENNTWRIAIQTIDENKQPIEGIPLTYIDVNWSNSHKIKTVDLLGVDEKSPYAQFDDILFQFSHTSDGRQLDLNINKSDFTYSYFNNDKDVSRELIAYDKKTFKTIKDQWKLTRLNDEIFSGIDSLKHEMETFSNTTNNSEQIININMSMLLTLEAENITHEYTGNFPQIALNEKAPNNKINHYFAQNKLKKKQTQKITNIFDAESKLKEFSKNYNYDEFEQIGKFALQMNLDELIAWLNNSNLTEKDQSFLIHSLDNLGTKEAFAKLRELLNSSTLSDNNRYRAMLSLTKATPQSIENYQVIEQIALNNNVDPSLQYNAAIQMVTIGRLLGEKQLKISLHALDEYMSLPNAKKDVFLLAKQQSGEISAYQEFLSDLHPNSGNSVVGRSAVAEMVVFAALENDNNAYQVLTSNYLTETDAQVIKKYNKYFYEHDVDQHYSEEMYQKIAQSVHADERKARIDALTHNQKVCRQHEIFLKSYVDSKNVDQNNVRRVKVSCKNIG